MKQLALVFSLALAIACARNGQPDFAPMPEARHGQIELDPQEATKKLADAMTAAGLPVTEVATREGFVSTAWYDTATRKRAGSRPLGTDDVRIRAWVMPWRYGWSEITMEAVYRPLADPSRPERELERSVPYDHPARVAIREIMQGMGATSTLAESDAPKPVLKTPIGDPGRLGKPGVTVPEPSDTTRADSISPKVAKGGRDSIAVAPADTARPAADSLRPRRDSAIVFRPRTPGDTIHQRARPDTTRNVRPDTIRAAPVPAVDTTRAAPPAPPAPPVSAAPTSGYAVQVAAPSDAYTANDFSRRLQATGYRSRIVTEDGRYKVRSQLYANHTDAAIALERLRRTFSDAFLVEE